ncbi:NADH-quinone oxidoreductase subunit C [Arcticibacter tournemirensis]|uniref:NADH-quinone oxidoreductase subunit C n=1 Tax=Arcticibacter tournemirensis TaxID=699437 RepID=A0A4Q0M780_9SPHI|nr:NADH-quinone oxidoreductase subunit C [Arcticibacter tournemirensis]RXF68874.1 NADH-quinone oxidoreductase subunit C [Arcticibacter tournemirensis]
MGFEENKALLINKFGEGIIVGEEVAGLQPALIISPERIAEVCLELRDNEKTWFDVLSCLSGVDYGIEENMFGVVYNLASIPYKTQLTLKVRKYHDRSREELPSFPTVSSIWKTADWHEREAYDLLGICFEDHPDLRRILLPDDWEGYPLRKDYKVQEYYHGIKVD